MSHWDEKIARYKEECTKLEEMLLEKQQKDFAEYENNLHNTLPTRFKDSAKLIEAKAMVQKLANNQEYKDAHYLQQKVLKMEQEEEEKFKVERETKIRLMLEQYIQKQKTEHATLRKKILTGLEELELKKEREYEMLMLKYSNMKKTIDTQQNMETQMFEKTIRTNSSLPADPGDLNRSTMTNLKLAREREGGKSPSLNAESIPEEN